MKLYVSNLNLSTKECELIIFFQKVGEVSSVNDTIDRYTGDSKGFGFVGTPDDRKAVTALNPTLRNPEIEKRLY